MSDRLDSLAMVEAINEEQGTFSVSTTRLLRVSWSLSDPLVLRSQVELRLSQLEREARALRSRRNDTMIACRLPPEILSKIFLDLVSPGSKPNGTHPYEWDARKDDLSWIWITHVCQHWREVALDCQALWCDLPLKRPATLETFLGRSRTAPLTIQYHGHITEIEQILRGVVGPETHRLRTLGLTSRAQGFIEGLLSESTSTAPLLETLHLILYGMHADRLPLNFLQGGSPSLTRLEIDGVGFTWGALPISASLRDLILREGHALNGASRPSASALINSMQQMPSLQTLELQRLLPDITPTTVSLLTFSALVDLRLHDTTERISQFLEISSLPKTVSISLGFTGNPNLLEVPRLLASINTSRRNPIGGHLLNTGIHSCSLGLDILHGPKFELQFHDRISQLPLQLRLLFHNHSLTSRSIFLVLREHMDFAPLHNIHISAFSPVSRNDWKAMFGRLPKLSEIGFFYSLEPLLTLCEVLIEDTPEQSDGHPDAPPWFPALKTLNGNSMQFESSSSGKGNLISALSQVVGRRSEAFPALELHVQKSTNFDHTDKAAFAALIPKLRLVWDGYVDCRNRSSGSGSDSEVQEDW